MVVRWHKFLLWMPCLSICLGRQGCVGRGGGARGARRQLVYAILYVYERRCAVLRLEARGFYESSWVDKPLPPGLFAIQRSLRPSTLCSNDGTVLFGVHGVLESGRVSDLWYGSLVSFLSVCYLDDVL